MNTRFVNAGRNPPLFFPPDLRNWIPEDDWARRENTIATQAQAVPWFQAEKLACSLAFCTTQPHRRMQEGLCPDE